MNIQFEKLTISRSIREAQVSKKVYTKVWNPIYKNFLSAIGVSSPEDWLRNIPLEILIKRNIGFK